MYLLLFFFFFFNDTATTEIYTLSLHDALPILSALLDFRRFVTMPAIVSRLPPVDFSRPPINAVTVDHRTRFGISATLGVVFLAKRKLKVRIGRFFCLVSKTIQR